MVPDRKSIVTNRKALHDYSILEKYEAGIVINGNEVKSLRENKASLQDSFCRIDSNEIYIYNLHIAPYEKSTRWGDSDSKRKRKLLLHKREIIRLFGKMTQRGLELIPLDMYFNNSGMVKVTVSLAKKRTGPDKRELLKKKDLEREMRQSSVRVRHS